MANISKDSKENCPLEATIKLLEKKWMLLIIHELTAEEKRFCQLQTKINNLNPRTLTLRLKELEREGIVSRTVKAHIPPWVEYKLTAKGRGLLLILKAVDKWAHKWANVLP